MCTYTELYSRLLTLTIQQNAITIESDLLMMCDILSIFSLKTLLDGYKFPVFTTKLCPQNETEWRLRSIALNCTGKNSYMCMPNEQFTMLIEFCYILPKISIPKGKQVAI